MRIKFILTALLGLVTVASCVDAYVEETSEGLVPVTLSVSAGETKAGHQFTPRTENTMRDLWILQYNSDNEICLKIPVDLEADELSATVKGLSLRPGRSTLVVIANFLELEPDVQYPWPGALEALYSTPIDAGLDLGGDGPDHLVMVGTRSVDVKAGMDIGMMLSRVCCKLTLVVHQAGDEFSDLSFQVVNAARPFTIHSSMDALEEEDLMDYAPETVSGKVPTGRADAVTRYYYFCENLSSDPDMQTMVRVSAKRNGTRRSMLVPVTSHGGVYRNTNYTLDLTLRPDE
ncbi:MAG: hypothetical protein MJY97_08130 [Bacteroidales bacterium]|nr:hypothetical protein [Bacteroidales bacterium]